MVELEYTIDDEGTVHFPASGHDYHIRPHGRGKPAIKLEREGAVLYADRLDPNSARERRAFVKALGARPEAATVEAELLALAKILDEDDEGEPIAQAAPRAPLYVPTDAGLVVLKPTKDGPTPVPLTNFDARIVGDIAEDDGTETRRTFEIEATLAGRTRRFPVPADRFAGLAWAREQLGAGAIVYAGQGVADHARVAVQTLSGNVPERLVFTHSGWREIDSAWAYLHAGGAMGAGGPLTGVDVQLPPALGGYILPAPPTGAALVVAIRASLGLLAVAPDPITLPLYAAVWRAPLGPSDFSVHLAGRSGEGKSELCALLQQHYGVSLDARHLPGSWSSTDNALEGLAFHAQDALLVVDDFAPGATPADSAQLQRRAERLFRAQGNRSGRMRMRQDGSLRPPKPPRGTILSTGEDVPGGQSVRGRLLILDLPAGALAWDALTACQVDARRGRYAEALAGYVRWLAGRYDDVRRTLPTEVARLRDAALGATGHRRTPELAANLAVGFHYFLAYAEESRALTPEERETLSSRAWAALGEAAAAQAQYQEAFEPTRQFLVALAGMLAGGDAHVADRDGDAPATPERWGWRTVSVGGDDERRSQGRRIGWVDGDDLYLEPEASYTAAQEFARRGGGALAVSAQTLRKRLRERGLLASVDAARGTLTVRRTLAGASRDVLHLRTADAVPPPDPAVARAKQDAFDW